ncbi:MAG: precorrin-3B C(17)-methyltransferase [Candidatus Brocadia sp. AMX2]|uniref:Precorrin-3B methylase n=1 Tax=Candidatus Brocadia sinica JPN1 TaxID=1197129 RepID=A0ABQ0K139_9BACT|nr:MULTISPECIES: precorrin-3B C(17)-methyltransferase [Brocadia]MBC6933276.1 precorrin-3B C(17)-methyltransferase [Candidatus Brocadia sp.]MBL1170153.1 precorrin-3B C(17)-methyltransferase [Candidatus Brocadia sp. AMX1]MCK6469474.1 precorrin-3B C(17)-methyltransferase [Candidatus Brocadia sinica]NOG42521.1 precorrin-3B C(17)-methyltransferase [Planctomycetota bacterium]KAA0242165.1 MAG: precorrin-3B C(17)-methyltransferase [Candidatus Brocadia sp. AMX2]
MVGIGPGARNEISQRALDALKDSETIVGYKLYVDLVKDIVGNKQIVASAMRKEIERVEMAIQEALAGKIVSLISSGDPGVYGMAGLVLEVVSEKNIDLPLEIISGIPAANAAAAVLGAPLMHDYAVISLSDLLTPWETIERRVKCAAEADFVIVLYNPRSSQRDWQIEKTAHIILHYKSPATPVGIVKDASRKDESVIITTLDKMTSHPIDMTTVIIVGNSTTFQYHNYLVTKRGYQL